MNTTKEAIAAYWESRVDEMDLNCDVSEFLTHCWNCGNERNTERCHIIPKSLKGADKPSNYVLLCRKCHEIAPNCSNKNIMWDWIKSNKTITGFYGGYDWEQAWKEYERIYKVSLLNLFDQFQDYDINQITKEISKWTKSMNNFSTHYSVGVTTSTRVGVLKDLVDHLFKKFPDKRLAA